MDWMKSMIGMVLAISILLLAGCETPGGSAAGSDGSGHVHQH